MQHVGISQPLENECSSYGSTYSDDEDEDVLSNGSKVNFLKVVLPSFVNACQSTLLKKGFDFKYVKNDKKRVVAEYRLKQEYGCSCFIIHGKWIFFHKEIE